MTPRGLLSLALAAALAGGCALLPAQPPEGPDVEIRTYEGVLTLGLDVQAFRPCLSRQPWWVHGTDADPIWQQYRAARFERPGPVYARVRATVSGVGRFGPRGTFRREMRIEDILEVRPLGTTRC